MEQDRMAGRQLWPLLFGGLLAPAAQLLPAPGAGALGWAAPLMALPAALALTALLAAVCRLGSGDYRESLDLAWGRWGGGALATAYLLWGTALAGWTACRTARRFLSAGYGNGPRLLFIVVWLALGWRLARGSAGRLARAGRIFYLALAGGLWLALLLALPQFDPKNLVPAGGAEVLGALCGSGGTPALLGVAVFAGFLGGRVRWERDALRWGLRWTARLCLAAAAAGLLCLAAFGAPLAARMEEPLLMLVRGVGVRGGFEHIEAVFIAVWSLSDLLLAGVLLLACRGLGEGLLLRRAGKYAAAGVSLAAFAGALVLFPDAVTLKKWEEVGGWIALVMGVLLPAATLVLGGLRQNHRG